MRYRAEIDGLRSFAIIPVVLYHYGLVRVNGGFVGVDVFFVISGFLITSLLLKDIDANDFSIVDFYERRARRILPALFFVLSVTTLLALLVLLPVDLINYGKSLLSTIAFAANIFFWRESGYFDRAAEMKPLLHAWSLSVEEQFYIVFPLCLWVIARMARPRLAQVIAAWLALSMTLSILAATRWPVAGFYLPATRAWELLIGAFLASGVVSPIRNSFLRGSLVIIGLVLIVASGFLINLSMAFPGWIAMFPCLGAALIILVSLSGGSIADRLLQSKPLVGIGLISYSLYLWHWPLLVIANYRANRELQVGERIAVLAVAVLLAIVSWRYIEMPFRGARSRFERRDIFAFAGVASAIAAVAGALLIGFAGFPDRLPSNVLDYADVASEQQLTTSGCFGARVEDVREGRLCRRGAASPAPASFLVWGDSHADRMSVPIAEIASKQGRVGLIASVSFCPPLVGVKWPAAGCALFSEEVVKLVERERLEFVILSAMWATYAEGTRFKRELISGTTNVLADQFSQTNNWSENPAVFGRALRRTVERITRAGARAIVIGPVPEIDRLVPESLAKSQWFGGPKNIGPTAADFMARQHNVFFALRAIEQMKNVVVLYPSTISCTPDCDVERLGRVLYIDDNHLSRAGLDLIAPLLAQAFNSEVGSASSVTQAIHD